MLVSLHSYLIFTKFTCVEVIVSNFIVMHCLSFECADHLSTLFGVMLPDSTIASDFSYKHTKTRAIIMRGS